MTGSPASLAVAAVDAAGDAVTTLTDRGVLGGLVVLLGLFAWNAYRREVKRADRLEDENSRLRDGIETRVVPLVERALATIEQARADRRAVRSTDDTYGRVDIDGGPAGGPRP